MSDREKRTDEWRRALTERPTDIAQLLEYLEFCGVIVDDGVHVWHGRTALTRTVTPVGGHEQ